MPNLNSISVSQWFSFALLILFVGFGGIVGLLVWAFRYEPEGIEEQDDD